MTLPSAVQLAVIGGGPAGLMAAETAAAAGLAVAVFDAMPSVGRKFLRAGVGGLNLTHSEPAALFRERFAGAADWVGPWLDRFDADATRLWARRLGIETFVGSSGRVFPAGMKAAPLLRSWLRRLRESGVAIHVRQRWLGWDAAGRLRFAGPDGEHALGAAATVLALGGGSWPQLGSDGRWTALLAERGIDLAPLRPANCGFEVAGTARSNGRGWSAHFAARHVGQPLKPVALQWRAEDGSSVAQQGELMISAVGLEGGLLYAHAAALREAIASAGVVQIHLDLAPGRSEATLAAALAQPRGKHSLAWQLDRRAGLTGARAGLLHELLPRAQFEDPLRLAAAIKALPLRLDATRPLVEAISSAGGVRRSALDHQLMLLAMPGVYCCGEMLDWEAPTGGYLLAACLASGVVAGAAVARRLQDAGELPA